MTEEEQKMPKPDVSLEINIELSDDNELITLEFKTDDRTISVGFNLQEAQLLSLVIGEKVSEALLKKMQLFPHQSENLH